jgi:hypothetical protein
MPMSWRRRISEEAGNIHNSHRVEMLEGASLFRSTLFFYILVSVLGVLYFKYTSFHTQWGAACGVQRLLQDHGA